jgi:enoyl-CoA hydratase/carnithine racemase
VSDAPVRLERDGPVASIVLDNPPLNLFGDAVFSSLVDCIDEIEQASDVRCVVWRAEGEVFTAGVDVNVFQRLVDAGDDGTRTFGSLLGPVRRLEAPSAAT